MKKIGIIGRVNVGKSSLFNVLTEKRKAIVSEIAGTTRDFLTGDLTDKSGHVVAQLYDFGGIDFGAKGEIDERVQAQVRSVMGECDLILFVVDAKTGLTHDDMRIRDIVVKIDRPVVLVVNKVDSDKWLESIYDFHKLGIEEHIAISVAQHRHILDLRRLLFDKVGSSFEPVENIEDLPKVAFIGRPNAGKSSLFNRLIQKERSIVSAIPGTTRDTVDSLVEIEGKKMVVLDTAGLRRRGRVTELLEGFSTKIALAAVRNADIVCYVIDHTDGVVAQDIKLLSYIEQQGKNCLVIMNKWDLATSGLQQETFARQVGVDNAIFTQLPIVFTSAQTGRGVDKLSDTLLGMLEKMHTRISTGKLNQYVPTMLATFPGFFGKIKYATQVGTNPLQFVFFVNKKELFTKKVLLMIKKRIRSDFSLSGIGLEIILKGQDRSDR